MNRRKPYTSAETVAAYRALALPPDNVIYIVSDIGRLMRYETPGRDAVLAAHFAAINQTCGDGATIVVPSASMNLLNTDTVFDPETTPSHKVGIFSEFVRQQPGAIRSFHPFNSYTAIGPMAESIVRNVSRSGYGWETPEARMVAMGATTISIGLEPRMTASTTHHAEQMMTVPYRYMKEFMHPVKRDVGVRTEPFYMYLMYRRSDVSGLRNFGENLFNAFAKDCPGAIRAAELGAGRIYAYSMRDYFDAACRVLRDDVYAWCSRPPEVRPWTK